MERLDVGHYRPKKIPGSWFVRDNETQASTNESSDWEDYYKLKRVWRRSKEDFDSACRFMKFNDLFSAAGVEV